MKWQEYPIHQVTTKDKDYPKILKKIKNPPPVLFFRGNLDQELFKKSLAIVGTRRMTHYGKMVIEKFIPFLVKEEVTIISGFMYGVDSEVHRKTLEFSGKTIAVLGNGLNIIYPPENQKLYEEILKNNGVIISQYEPNFKPKLWTFPQRNRIVAGLSSLGVLIIEAGEKSGALITANFAQKQGKKVFAVPGPITSSVSKGTNLLIKTHRAKMVIIPEDILQKTPQNLSLFSKSELSYLEKVIYQLLENEPLNPDEIALITKKNITEINRSLSLMCLRGIVSEFAGKYYLNV